METPQIPQEVDNITVSGAINPTPVSSDSSVFDMFWNAGFMIKVVVLSLLLASIWSWAIIISKHLKLKRLNIEANVFEDNFWSGAPLEALYHEMKDAAYDPMSNVFCAAMTEWMRFSSGKLKSSGESGARSVEQRVERIMQIAIRKEIDELEKGLGFLSSLGTNGVIIGLFGTVIGILNGFKAIALQQSTSIATVAPVISEALFTTALGIVAAIPAALCYNKFMTDTNRYINRLETFADELNSIISRQFDE
ncbi:MAG: protein TolQ [Holosporales bacterium]|jgi:biopolymer transport protein TolQ|nr:protein TolQ [Holosporales bacterium]